MNAYTSIELLNLDELEEVAGGEWSVSCTGTVNIIPPKVGLECKVTYTPDKKSNSSASGGGGGGSTGCRLSEW